MGERIPGELFDDLRHNVVGRVRLRLEIIDQRLL